MNNIVLNIILGTQSESALESVFGTEYNEQNDRYKKVVLLFISKAKKEITYGRMKPELANEKVNNLMRLISNPSSKCNQYILGSNLPFADIDLEVSSLLGIYKTTSLDDVEDIFAEKETSIGISDYQLEEYRQFPELLERDIQFGVISSEQAKLINEKFAIEGGSNMGKTLTKSKPAFHSKEIDLGFVEPILLSAIVSLMGLLYVAYLYLVV